jgi:SNF2 family DNA or RNA helicase
MDMLKELIGDRAQIYSGKLNAEQKGDVIEWSHQPGDKVLLVQLQSGGVGLNLQHFNRILFTGPWWTQALMDQAVGRAVRIGQSDVVEVHHLILKEEETMNIDKYIQEKATEKGELCRAVLAAASSVLK